MSSSSTTTIALDANSTDGAHKQKRRRRSKGGDQNQNQKPEHADSEAAPAGYGLEAYAPLVSCKWWELLSVSVDEDKASDTKARLARGARVLQGSLTGPGQVLSDASTQKVYDEYSKGFEALVRYDDQQKWLNKMVSVGTTSDRIAALVMKVQMAPLFALNDMKALVKLAQKKSRNESGAACDALRDLFIELLPAERKLLSLQQNVGASIVTQNASASSDEKSKDNVRSCSRSVLLYCGAKTADGSDMEALSLVG